MKNKYSVGDLLLIYLNNKPTGEFGVIVPFSEKEKVTFSDNTKYKVYWTALSWDTYASDSDMDYYWSKRKDSFLLIRSKSVV